MERAGGVIRIQILLAGCGLKADGYLDGKVRYGRGGGEKVAGHCSAPRGDLSAPSRIASREAAFEMHLIGPTLPRVLVEVRWRKGHNKVGQDKDAVG